MTNFVGFALLKDELAMLLTETFSPFGFLFVYSMKNMSRLALKRGSTPVSKKTLAARLTFMKPPAPSGTTAIKDVKVPKRSEKVPPRFDTAAVERTIAVPTTVDTVSLTNVAAFLAVSIALCAAAAASAAAFAAAALAASVIEPNENALTAGN